MEPSSIPNMVGKSVFRLRRYLKCKSRAVTFGFHQMMDCIGSTLTQELGSVSGSNLDFKISSSSFRQVVKHQMEPCFLVGIMGLNSFDPEEVETKIYEAPLVFSSIQVLDRVVLHNTANATPIKLKHDQDKLRFHFSLQNFSYPGQNLYSYQLLGFDPLPSPYSNVNFASYTALRPGEYEFFIKAKTPDDKSGNYEVISRVAITIDPPFWGTW